MAGKGGGVHHAGGQPIWIGEARANAGLVGSDHAAQHLYQSAAWSGEAREINRFILMAGQRFERAVKVIAAGGEGELDREVFKLLLKILRV